MSHDITFGYGVRVRGTDIWKLMPHLLEGEDEFVMRDEIFDEFWSSVDGLTQLSWGIGGSFQDREDTRDGWIGTAVTYYDLDELPSSVFHSESDNWLTAFSGDISPDGERQLVKAMLLLAELGVEYSHRGPFIAVTHM